MDDTQRNILTAVGGLLVTGALAWVLTGPGALTSAERIAPAVVIFLGGGIAILLAWRRPRGKEAKSMPSKGPKSGGDSQYNAGRDQNVANVGKVEPGGIGQQINNINQAPEPEVRIPRVGKPEQRADGLYVTTYEVHIDSAYAVNRIELQVHSCRELRDPSYSLGPVDLRGAAARAVPCGALAAAAPAAAAPAASVDAEAAYRKAAISALRNRPEFGQRLASGHGVASGKVQASLTQAAPPEEVVGDRFEWAYQVVRPALLGSSVRKVPAGGQRKTSSGTS